MSGRIKACPDTTHITMDQPVTFQVGLVYTLTVVLPTGAIQDCAIVNPGNVSTATITLSSALSQVTLLNAVFVITSNTSAPINYRILSITDKSSETDIWYEVVGMSYVSSKFNSIENNLVLQTYASTALTSKYPVTSVIMGEYHVATAKGTRHVVTVAWAQQTGARSYVLKWRRNNSEWSTITDISSPYSEFEVPDVGTIDTTVSVNYINGQSNPTPGTYVMTGKNTAPAAPTGLNVAYTNSGLTFTWTKNTEGDVIAYEIRRGSSGSTWATATVVSNFLGSNIYQWSSSIPFSCILFVAAIDASGNQSAPSQITVNPLPAPTGVTITIT